MKVLLIFPNYLENFFVISASFYPPLGIAMVAASLKNAGHDVHVIDATAERMNIHVLTREVMRIQPDLIGFTSNIAYAYKALITARWLKIKLPSTPIMFGGPWATSRYDYLLSFNAIDYVVLGEGEDTVVLLVHALLQGGDLTAVKGIAFKKDGIVIKTESRPFNENLDALPFPAWELIPPPSKYFWDPKGRRYYPVMTSRGCPYGCINCSKLVHGYKIRYRSIDNVMAEIKYLHEKFQADEIIFIDDGFNYEIERAERICDEITKIGFKIHLRFTNGLRADKITPRLAWKLKKAGAYDVVLGIESGNQQLVNKIGKNLDLGKVEHAVQLLKKNGLFTSGFFMVGLPGETIRSLIDTKQFAKKLDLDIALISRAIPFPGTRMYDIVKKNGKFSTDFEKSSIFYHERTPAFEMAGMPAWMIEIGFQDLYRNFYLNSARLKKIMKRFRLKNWRIYFNFLITTLLNVFSRRKKTMDVGFRAKNLVIKPNTRPV
jgi:anaerobic magnesium-protoporphyrin IX monomethyl ester cyclase